MANYTAILRKEPFDGQYSAPSVIVTLALGLALYNCVELTLLIMTTFKRWKGLYFWSLSLCNFGVASYGFGMVTDYWKLTVLWASKVLVTIGWMTMITCQSLVLYSRLGLLVDNDKILKGVKWMIIINSCVVFTIVDVLDWGSTYSSDYSYTVGYYYIELIQISIFTLQELIISGLYVWKTFSLLQIVSKENTRSMVMQVLTINLMIICMDIALFVMQFKHMQLYQESFKILFYSIKLKLEMNILSKLVDLVHGSSVKNRSMTLEAIDSNAVQGQAQRDVQREMASPGSLVNWYAGDTKSGMASYQNDVSPDVRYRPSMSLSGSGSSPTDDAEITRVLSHPTSVKARANGREVDALYADYLRSVK
ncbi:uncharacterized protein A1O9_10262 [Exophiala aquamarina CBS 119918]|uniref:DUF7703 domain-containing protein n=1 Tax=Exophiala aquamarina CBS 119918 TaxID=1182545 RepID=A0A072PE88_9EURO|nr:uncharacterized protein A1O9_10262 [Exophiala aquamarina CBS 119918]KEF53860.1 hypothetical protein A1O9_10262 [Exophiala aquamarina CBS 119918]